MSGVKQYGATAADGGYAAASLPLSGTEGLLVRQSDAVLYATAQDIANLATGGASGDIVAGTNISLSGTATGRLKGAGSLTVNATSPTGTGYTHITAGVRDAAASSAATVTLDLQGDGSSASSAGFRGAPLNSQSAAYGFVLSDNGKMVYHPSADTTARTWTIPANASLAFPIGAIITVDNDQGAGALTIAITSDTLVQVGTGATGSRTLASGGSATFWKVAATRWRINGTGLT